MPTLTHQTQPSTPTADTANWTAALGVLDAGAAAQDAQVDAKVTHASNVVPVVGAAASAIRSADRDDHVQLAADALKLSAETVAKRSAVAGSLDGSSQLLTGINKALRGDAYGTAVAVNLAAEKLAPALSHSSIGAVTNVVLLSLGDDRVRAQANDIEQKARLLVEPGASGADRVTAALDLSVSLQSLAYVLRTLSQSLVNVAAYAVRAMQRSPVLAPTASSLSMVAKEMAATPGGRLVSRLNRWLPLINVAGVALSGKTAIEVFRTASSSGTSKALALASLATSLVAAFAVVNLGVIPFIALIGTSVALDLGLARSRQHDAEAGGLTPSPTEPRTAKARKPIRLVG
jgi:hypothetical protein